MIMLSHMLRKATAFATARTLQHHHECYLTIYSDCGPVVGETVDQYLDPYAPLAVIEKALRRGQHSLFVSESLMVATERLIALKKRGRIADVSGAACHLVACTDARNLKRLMQRRKDFRLYLRELGQQRPAYPASEQGVTA